MVECGDVTRKKRDLITVALMNNRFGSEYNEYRCRNKFLKLIEMLLSIKFDKDTYVQSINIFFVLET